MPSCSCPTAPTCPTRPRARRTSCERRSPACREAGLALILEPIVYKREGEERAGEDRYAELVVEGARRLAALEPDVLKLQYPGTAAGCEALDAAVGR